MNFIKRNIIELSIFFVFLLYFSAWFIFNNDNVLINNDELDFSTEYDLKSNLTSTLISKLEMELNKPKLKSKKKLKK